MGRGTGLGLASVYGIIKAHSGYIEVESTSGLGSTFRIYLHAAIKPIPMDKSLDSQLKKGKATILLVDDEEMVLSVGVQMLEALGYKVFSAESGQRAVSLFAEHRSDIDLVILDLIMPELSGGDTYDAIKKINPNVRVLLSSGYSIDGQAIEILNRGGNGFIQKPYGIDALSSKVNNILTSEAGAYAHSK